MTKISNADLRLTIPDDWTDRSVLVWSAPPGTAPIPPNFVVSHDTMQPEESLTSYANRQLDSLRGNLQGWQLIEQIQDKIAGRPALSLRFSWQMGPGRMMQRQSFVQLDGPRVISIGCTASEDGFDAADHDWFANILSSLQFNGK